MKPFSIHNGTLKINVSDLHTFLERYGLSFSSMADIHVKPIGVIVQCQVEHPPLTHMTQEELLTGLTDLIDEGKEDETVLYPVVNSFYAEKDNQLTVVPHGDVSYEHNHNFENIPGHFASGGEVPASEIDYVLYNGKKVHLFGEFNDDPNRTEVTHLITERIAAGIGSRVEKVNKKFFDAGYAYNLVINEIKERTKEFETPFVVSEDEIDGVIQKILE